MPELPDVELYKHRLDAAALHRKIISVTVADSRMLKGISPRKLQGSVKGRSVNSTRRHGKYLFAALDRKSGWIVFHFGMTGDLNCVRTGGRDRYARVLFDFTNKCRLLYRSRRRLGAVRLVDDAGSFIRAKGLGPDALAVGGADFDRILEKGRGSIKSLLMNQKAIAGIGNVYSDEILFQSRIHPMSRADRLDPGAAGSTAACGSFCSLRSENTPTRRFSPRPGSYRGGAGKRPVHGAERRSKKRK